VRKADNLTTIQVPLSCNLGTLTSWNPLGHSRPVTRLLYLFYIAKIAGKIQCVGKSKGNPLTYFQALGVCFTGYRLIRCFKSLLVQIFFFKLKDIIFNCVLWGPVFTSINFRVFFALMQLYSLHSH
jgi:hypothetical protein